MCISKLFIVVGHDSVDVRDSVRRKKGLSIQFIVCRS